MKTDQLILEKHKDKIGKKFGKLTFLPESKRVPNGKKQFMYHIKVKCDCGNISFMAPRRAAMLGDCGCEQFDRMASRKKTHGKSKTKEYVAWLEMIKRCYRPQNSSFDRYGGRGITVCEEWRESFEAFLSCVGLAPSKHHSIDRIDNDANYGPGNVRWATSKKQANNRRSNRIIKVGNIEMTLSEAARVSGLKAGTIETRINRNWKDKDLLKPTKWKPKEAQRITVDGLSMTLMESQEKYGINFKTISKRLKRGWSHGDACKLPNGSRNPKSSFWK